MISEERCQHHRERKRRYHKGSKHPNIMPLKLEIIEREVKRYQEQTHIQSHIEQIA